jgi:hypothetical protein
MLSQVTLRVRTAVVVTAAIVLAGCGAGGAGGNATPEEGLKSLAPATADSDDDAIAALICPEALVGGKTITETKALAKKGTDDDAAGQQFLEAALGPLPIGLISENGRINLVERDGKWLACK